MPFLLLGHCKNISRVQVETLYRLCYFVGLYVETLCSAKLIEHGSVRSVPYLQQKMLSASTLSRLNTYLWTHLLIQNPFHFRRRRVNSITSTSALNESRTRNQIDSEWTTETFVALYYNGVLEHHAQVYAFFVRGKPGGFTPHRIKQDSPRASFFLFTRD